MLMTVSLVLAPFARPAAAAAAPDPAAMKNLNAEITKLLYRNALATCVGYSPLTDDSWAIRSLDRINEQNASNYKWFWDGASGLGSAWQPLDVFAGRWLHDAGDSSVDEYGRAKCSDPTFISNAVKGLGYSAASGDSVGVFHVLCDLGFQRDGGDRCLSGKDAWYRSASGDAMRDKVVNSSNGKGLPGIDDVKTYKLLTQGLTGLCNATIAPKTSANLTQGVYDVTVYNQDTGQPETQNISFGTNKRAISPTGSIINLPQVFASPELYTVGITANDVGTANVPAGAWTAGQIIAGSVRIGSLYNGCTDMVNQINDRHLADAYGAWITQHKTKDGTKPADCSNGGTTDANGNPCPAKDKPSCAITGIGWIICPVITFLANIMDNVYGFLADNFLRTDIKLVDTSSPTHDAWAKMRDISNVVLIIVFLIMIYSQLTSFGISNYGLKKMFPRLVIAAILVNISFIVCQILVDLSNILGASMQSFFQSLGPQIKLGDVNSTTDVANASSALGVTGIALSVLGTAAGLYLILPFLGAMILAGLVAVLFVGFLLIARKALIVLLIVIAPLAVAAYMLPNTEQWFKKWQKMLLSLLLLYPIIAVVFGASQLASHILAPVADAATGQSDNLLKVVAAATAVLPLFIVPSLLKGSLNAIGNLGGAINKIGGKLQGAASKKGGELQNKGLGKLANTSFGRNAFIRRVGGRATGHGRRGYDALGAKAENESSQQILDGWNRDGTANDFGKLEEIARKNPGSAKGQAAIRQLAATGSVAELARLRKRITDPKDMVAYNRAIASQFAALKAKHPGAVMDMPPDEWAKIKQSDMHAMKDVALEEGARSSPEFRANLASALADPEQARHFTPNIHSKFGDGAPTSPPTPAGPTAGTPATPSSQQPTPSSPAPPSAPAETPGQRAAREAVEKHMQESGEADEWARWREQQQARESGGRHADEQGRQTPNGASDDYHDRMNQ
ncbi:type IV secretion system protein [Arthrobacter sp. KNU40]|uniref:type IV secretion system protein n=1 Tax=Arthrobacter sp. KNU40 TaxID=3447965 RepID=UPI003F5F27EC